MEPVIKTIGIIGGGQLGMMLIKYGIRPLDPDAHVRVLDPCKDCSCSCSHLENFPKIEIIKGSLTDVDDLRRLCRGCDVVTWEIEHINAEALAEIYHEQPKTRFIPEPIVLNFIQNKAQQKKFYQECEIPTLPFCITDTPTLQWDQLSHNVPRFECDAFKDTTVVYKDVKGGYDGRGVEVVSNEVGGGRTYFENAEDRMVVVEPYLCDRTEISVIVASDGRSVVSYEPVEMEFHEDANVLNVCFPYEGPDEMKEKLTAVAKKTVARFGCAGLYAVEMFVDKDGSIYVNETAPRVHNSGHHTIHSHNVSQFEMLARILLGLPLVQPRMKGPYCMKNLFGQEGEEGHWCPRNHMGVFPESGPFLVNYHKNQRPGRKIGHITHYWPNGLDVHGVREELEKFHSMISIEPSYAGHNAPGIGVVMGSRSDWPIMKAACEQLRECGVDYEATVVSAHRTPDRLTQYAKTARARGLKVIIAGAGGSAHLPGMLAANTTVPVIGVPIASEHSKAPHAALWSIVQMPAGVPVACMAINGAKNAALFALQMLGHHDLVQSLRDERENDVILDARLE